MYIILYDYTFFLNLEYLMNKIMFGTIFAII